MRGSLTAAVVAALCVLASAVEDIAIEYADTSFRMAAQVRSLLTFVGRTLDRTEGSIHTGFCRGFSVNNISRPCHAYARVC